MRNAEIIFPLFLRAWQPQTLILLEIHSWSFLLMSSIEEKVIWVWNKWEWIKSLGELNHWQNKVTSHFCFLTKYTFQNCTYIVYTPIDNPNKKQHQIRNFSLLLLNLHMETRGVQNQHQYSAKIRTSEIQQCNCIQQNEMKNHPKWLKLTTLTPNIRWKWVACQNQITFR